MGVDVIKILEDAYTQKRISGRTRNRISYLYQIPKDRPSLWGNDSERSYWENITAGEFLRDLWGRDGLHILAIHNLGRGAVEELKLIFPKSLMFETNLDFFANMRASRLQ